MVHMVLTVRNMIGGGGCLTLKQYIKCCTFNFKTLYSISAEHQLTPCKDYNFDTCPTK